MPEKLRYFRFGRFVFYIPSRDNRFGNEDAKVVMVFRPHKSYRLRNDWPMPQTALERSQYGEWKACDLDLADFLKILKDTSSSWDVIRTEMLSRRQVITKKLSNAERKKKLTELARELKTFVNKYKSPVAQPAEPRPVKPKVDGSNPSGRDKDKEPRWQDYADTSNVPDWAK